MYHDYISRKPRNIKPKYNFTEDRDKLLEIVNNMVLPDSVNVYPEYHIYKEMFEEFAHQIVEIDKHIHAKPILVDVSSVYVDEYKQINIKCPNIMELLKNKTIIYEKDIQKSEMSPKT